MNWHFVRSALLMTGAVVGLLMAGFEGLVFKGWERGAARINSVVISEGDYDHALLVLAQARRSAITEDDRKLVLDRLIENELLFQHAEKLGLSRNHGDIRRAVIRAMITFIIDDAEAVPPSDDVLRLFYRENRAWFTPTERVRVQRVYFRLDQLARAQKMATALQGGADFSAFLTKGDRVVVDLPDILLPAETLFQYLGEALTEKLARMKVGEVAGLLQTETGYHFLFLVARQKLVAPRFEDFKEAILRRYKIVQDQEKLRVYLERLRNQADVWVRP